ncbi:MAG: tyrosine-type recombinase/integrase [Pseudomonadota bacterium]
MPLKLHRRGAIFYLRGTVAGQRLYESTGLDDRKAADVLRARREKEIIERAAYGRSATISFAEAALTYLQSGGEARYLGPILQAVGPKFRLVDMSNDQVNRLAQLLYPTAAPATINRQLVTPISAVVNMAADDDLCPARRFRRRPGDNARIDWLTPEQAEAAFSVAGERGRRLLAFMLGTGCRASEALRLERADLHLDTCEAWVAEAKNDDPRMVRYPLRTRAVLATGWLPDLGCIFRTPKGLPYRLRGDDGRGLGGQVKGEMDRIRAAAGIPCLTPHVLRHTWATWYYAQTRDFGGLMDLGGWKKADMANRYRKIAPADLGQRLLAHGWDFRAGGAKDVQGAVPQGELLRDYRGLVG